MNILIDPEDPRFALGHAGIDDTHQEFIALINRIGMASKQEFAELFEQLVRHTEDHFESEKLLMEKSNFPAINEHLADHQRVLGELHRFGERVNAGSIALGRAYVIEQLPHWFQLHAATMDSALAAHLKTLAA